MFVGESFFSYLVSNPLWVLSRHRLVLCTKKLVERGVNQTIIWNGLVIRMNHEFCE